MFVFMFMFMSMSMPLVGMLMMVIVLMSMFVVVVVMMFMHVLIFFHAAHDDVRVSAFDTALDALFEHEFNIGNAQRIKLVLTSLYIACKFGQRCQEHVSCCAHIAFDVESLHALTSDVIDHAGRVSCAESVVDINYSDTTRA